MDAAARGTGVANVVNAAYISIERSNLYGFLAVIYREEPTAELLRRIKDPPFLRALGGVGITLDEDLLDRPEEQLVSDLELEYTRLFIGPAQHIPPHESVHSPSDTGSLWGRTTMAVKRVIESIGVEFRPGYHGIPDHISVDLEFMQRLTEIEAEAWWQDADVAARWLQIEQQFVEEHLAKWVPLFCERVLAAAEHSFYREMARLTRDFIALERQELIGLVQGDPVG